MYLTIALLTAQFPLSALDASSRLQSRIYSHGKSLPALKCTDARSTLDGRKLETLN
jgi:hypothetical protein